MNRRMVVTLSLLAVVGGLGIAVACSDGGVAPSRDTHAFAGKSTFSRIPGRRPATPAEFDARNRMHWVGVQHNRGVEAVRVALLAHTLHGGRLCEELPEFLAGDAVRLPGHAARPAAAIAARVRRGLLNVRDCGGQAASSVPAPSARGHAARPASMLVPPALVDQEATAEGLVSAIITDAEAASDPYSLAPVLDSLTSLSDGMDSIYVDGVYGTAALAMSSAEYWNDNEQDFVTSVERDYCDTEAPDPRGGPCMAVPYSLVAPAAMPAMLTQGFIDDLSDVLGADLDVLVSGGLASMFIKFIEWEDIALTSAGASAGCAGSKIWHWFRSKF